MAFGQIRSVLKSLVGSSANEETQDDVYEEVLLMTLAQASKADANIHPMEIETIQQIMRRETGQDLTAVDIRKASQTDMFESASLHKYLRRVQGQLNTKNKIAILQALIDVIKSDRTINVLEIDYYDRVVDALRMTPAEQIGLTA